jgi:hypothetical protein
MSDHSNGAEGLRQRMLDQLSAEQKIVEELSDEDLEIVTGVSIGNIGHLVTFGGDANVHNGDTSFRSAESGPPEAPAGNANKGHGVPKAWLATSAGLASGGAAAFSVGAITSKLSVTGS